MKELNIGQIIQAVGGDLLEGSLKPGVPSLELHNSKIKGVSIDSRKIEKGNLFVAIEGQSFDGHDFIKTACEKGAHAIIAHKKVEACDVPVILVKDTLVALQELAKYYLSTFNIKKVAITGSTGKTTTKEMLATVLETQFKVVKTLGNFNNHIGLPLSVFNIEEEHDIAVFEMGMNNLGEIQLLASIVKPDIAMITNIGLSHIENLGSRENIMKAKMEITHYFTKESILIINNDDSCLRTLSEENLGYKLLRIGSEETKADLLFTIKKVEDFGEKGIAFSAQMCNNTKDILLRVPGIHNAHNAMLALACGYSLGLELDKGIKALQDFKGYNMRLTIEKGKNGIKVINDAYNASPDSMKAAIDTLASMEGKRHIAILSDMLEMGSYAKEYHEKIGEYATAKGIDIMMTLGENARYMSEAAARFNKKTKVFHYESKDELLKALKNILSDEDILLVKGSRSMKMETIIDSILER